MLGLVLLVLGVTCLVTIFWPGPAGVAEAMGVACADSRRGPSHQCSWVDAADVLWTGFWVSSVAGLALLLITRPEHKGPVTIDIGRFLR